MIPRCFHWIWRDDRPLPSAYRMWMQGWLELHPGWQHRLWTDETRPVLQNEHAFQASPYGAQRADIMRYEIVFQFGGVYLDLDMECRRNIESLLVDVDAFIGEEDSGVLCPSIFGAVAGHPWLRSVIEALPDSLANEFTIPAQTGPGLITRVSRERSDILVLAPRYFYPYSWRERARASEDFPDAHAVHHWHNSWAADAVAEHKQYLAAARDGLECLVDPDDTIILIDSEGELTLRRSAPTIRFVGRPGYWGNPVDSLDAITELQRLMACGVDWVVFDFTAFWWFDCYPEFTEYVASRSTEVNCGRGFRGYRLARVPSVSGN